VPVAVVGRPVAFDDIAPGHQPPGEVRMARGDSRVDDRHDGAGPGRGSVRGVGLDHVEVPLLRPERVGDRRTRQRQAHEHRENHSPEHGAS
jgi:hypothetical protein